MDNYRCYVEGDTVYYPITRYYTDNKNNVQHLEFVVGSYVWNSTTMNCTDPTFLFKDKSHCQKLCDVLNETKGY
jgi:hypothetical protein